MIYIYISIDISIVIHIHECLLSRLNKHILLFCLWVLISQNWSHFGHLLPAPDYFMHYIYLLYRPSNTSTSSLFSTVAIENSINSMIFPCFVLSSQFSFLFITILFLLRHSNKLVFNPKIMSSATGKIQRAKISGRGKRKVPENQ